MYYVGCKIFGQQELVLVGQFGWFLCWCSVEMFLLYFVSLFQFGCVQCGLLFGVQFQVMLGEFLLDVLGVEMVGMYMQVGFDEVSFIEVIVGGQGVE